MNVITKPRMVEPKRRPWWRWIVVALVGIVGLAVIALLTIPILLSPPPSPGPGYELPVFGEASARLEPGVGTLLVTQDGLITVYVPAGAYDGMGTLVIQSRRPELVPSQREGNAERVRAVDLLVVDESQQVLSTAAFLQPILMCFKLDESQEALRQADPEAVSIQRFDDRPEALVWVDLPVGPGWEERQVCAALEHLSLFALTVRRTPTPEVATPTQATTPVAAEAPGLYAPPGLP